MTFDPSELDEGIRATVIWLRMHDFETTDSGDGSSKPEEARVFEEPHVCMVVEPERMIAEADRLRDLITSSGFRVDEIAPEGEKGIGIQASYDPAARSALIVLVGLVIP